MLLLTNSKLFNFSNTFFFTHTLLNSSNLTLYSYWIVFENLKDARMSRQDKVAYTKRQRWRY